MSQKLDIKGNTSRYQERNLKTKVKREERNASQEKLLRRMPRAKIMTSLQDPQDPQDPQRIKVAKRKDSERKDSE